MDPTPDTQPNFAARHRTALVVTAALVGALVVFAAVFDWNWLRGPVTRIVAERTGLTLSIGSLHVDPLQGLHTVMRNVQLANPTAPDAPLVSAGEIEMRLALGALLRGRPVFRYLSLSDARVNLVRDGEGNANWSRGERPKRDAQEAPPITLPFDIEALALRNVEVRFADAPRALDVHSRVSLDEAAGGSARRTRIEFAGRYGGHPFSGTALTGELLTLQNTRQPFPIEIELVAGRTKAAAVGKISDLLGDIELDGNVRIAGPSLATLYPTLPVALPSTPPYRIEGHLQAQKNDYRFTQLRGQIGRSDIGGDASFRMMRPRPLLNATLRSQRLALADLGVLVGVKDPASRKAVPQRVLPDASFDVPRMSAMDAAVSFAALHMVVSPALALENFATDLKLAEGVLHLEPMKFGFSGGDIVSTIVLDSRRAPMRAEAAVDFRRIQFSQMFPTLDRNHLSAGTIGAQMRLTGAGQSVAELLASANGNIAAAMSGGRISQTVVAAASLNGGRLLPLVVTGDKPVPVRCAAVLMEVKQGIARSHLLVLDTESTRIDGALVLDLARERLELELRPKPKSPGILSLRAPVYVEGSFRDPRTTVGQGALLRGAAALALSAVNPLVALLPLIETGPGEDTNCGRALKPVGGALDQSDEATSKAPTPPRRKR